MRELRVVQDVLEVVHVVVVQRAHQRTELPVRDALAELAAVLAAGARLLVELLGVWHAVVQVDEHLLPREQIRELLLRRLVRAAVEDLLDEAQVVQLQRAAQRLRLLLELAVDLDRTLQIRIRIRVYQYCTRMFT